MNHQQKPETVAIVVALSARSYLTPSEEISLKHLRHHLGGFDKYIVIPKSLDFSLPDFGVKRFDDRFFGSADAHKKLMFSRAYYEAFSDYTFILTYHPDALVFSDELEKWCDMDFDFIGPPWIKHEDAPYAGNASYEGKVGNSGFSLKKVSSFLKIFDSAELCIDPDEYWAKFHAGGALPHRILNFPKKLIMNLHGFNNSVWEMEHWNRSEELFIVNRASHYYPEFKIAPPELALQFGFEAVPAYCYELNHHRLPFGCHAWERYDRKFWEQFLL